MDPSSITRGQGGKNSTPPKPTPLLKPISPERRVKDANLALTARTPLENYHSWFGPVFKAKVNVRFNKHRVTHRLKEFIATGETAVRKRLLEKQRRTRRWMLVKRSPM